ncbi:lipoyl protein ligase domain-containing protein [Pseudarthrobacter enclensis]|uniref:Lipoate-protein ligase A n=1 Tax=Pseudarthrobacter enclensis TaxID=993070 RepID=A0ABT9RZS8_9MICC|nr:lipoate--protein ligase family protein [Pseudarthrobacter enclensis]MDP9890748.1 lipoate-protein ligase A [Pseudarthrobacter enclensis]
MTGAHPPFGAGVVRVVHDPRPRPGDEDMAFIADSLAALPGAAGGELNLSRPLATAAFSRRDSLRPGYVEARTVLAGHGYAPIIRPVGGHLAVYGPGDMVVHLWAPHPDARASIRERFEAFAEAVTRALQGLGADARVGAVPGEYCTGEFSVNHSGRAKLVGTGQRLTRHGYLFSAVIMVEDSGPARTVLEEAYALMGLDFRPESVGCVADAVPGATVEDVREALIGTLKPLLQHSAHPAHFPSTASPAGRDPHPRSSYNLSGASRVH